MIIKLELWTGDERELRGYQTNLVRAIRETVSNGVRRMVVRLPTGGGKTAVAAAIARGALLKGNELSFTCPRIDLVDQTLEAFGEDGILDCGVLQANHPLANISAPIQICSIDTLGSRGYYPDVPVIIFDEIHILKKYHIEYMDRYPDAIFIGLSATPWRQGLAKHFKTMIIGATMKELMKEKYLCDYRLFAPSMPNLKGIKKIGGDYNEKQLSKRMIDSQEITADVIQTWLSHPIRDRTLVYAVDRAHAKLLQKRFQEAGVNMEYQDGFTEGPDRKELKRKFQNREIAGIVSVETMLIGNDLDARCISCVRPTQSDMLWVQLFGRGLRPGARGADIKEDLLFLDHSGNSITLGFPEDIEEKYDALLEEKDINAKKPPALEKLPKPCPKCSFMKPPKVAVCPSCGFKAEVVSDIIEKDGVLVEITRSGNKVLKKLPNELWTEQQKRMFHAELRCFALEKGRSDNWASHGFKKKFGDFPPWKWKDWPPAPEVGVAVKAYCKYLDIQYINSKAYKGKKK